MASRCGRAAVARRRACRSPASTTSTMQGLTPAGSWTSSAVHVGRTSRPVPQPRPSRPRARTCACRWPQSSRAITSNCAARRTSWPSPSATPATSSMRCSWCRPASRPVAAPCSIPRVPRRRCRPRWPRCPRCRPPSPAPCTASKCWPARRPARSSIAWALPRPCRPCPPASRWASRPTCCVVAPTSAWPNASWPPARRASALPWPISSRVSASTVASV